MPHDMRNDYNFNGNLLGNGFRGTRGWVAPTLYPQEQTRLTYAEAVLNSVSRYFNPERSYTDTLPTLQILTPSTTTPASGQLGIQF
jgi:hypothetical protein